MVAVLALIIAMGGTSYAVTQLPRNSVGTPQLKTDAVTAAKIKADAVTGDKVKDGSLAARDFAAGTLLQGPTGPRGPAGPAAEAAASEIFGSDAELGMTDAYQTVLTIGTRANQDSTGTITVTVPSNLVVTANLTFREATGVHDARVGCDLQYRALPSPSWLPFTYGGLSTMLYLAGNAQTTLVPNALEPVPAGTYDVQARCKGFPAGGGAGEFLYGSMTVVATEQ